MTTAPTCCCADWIGTLARTHARRLVAVARREGLSGDDALDAVQDGLGALLGHPLRAQVEADPDGAARLVTAMVRNAARNLRRRHHRARPHAEVTDADVIAPGPDAAQALAAADDVARLEGCVAGLSELHRQVVALRVLEEVSGDRVARRLGLQPGHVAVLLHRARAQLAACMAA
jgi:RNA polymerase sigma-70 factor (ECF subfamily)